METAEKRRSLRESCPGSGSCELVERANEDSQLEGLKVLRPQDVEPIGADKLNSENRQQDWGQEKDGFSGNPVRTSCLPE